MVLCRLISIIEEGFTGSFLAKCGACLDAEAASVAEDRSERARLLRLNGLTVPMICRIAVLIALK